MRVKKIASYMLFGVGGVIALLVLGVVALLVFVNPNNFRPQIQQMAQDAGIKLELAGSIEWQLYPRIGIELNQTKLYPYDSDKQLLEVGKVSLSMGLFELFFGDIRIKGIELHDVEAKLAKDSQGKGNWEKIVQSKKPTPEPPKQNPEKTPSEPTPSTTDPSSKKASSPLPTQLADVELDVVSLSNIRLSYSDERSGQEVGLVLESFVLKNFRFGEWFAVELALATNLNNPAAAVSADGGFEAMILKDIKEIRLRQLAVEVEAETELLGEQTQQVKLELGSLLFDQLRKIIDVKGMKLQADAQLPQLGEARQKATLSGDINLALATMTLGAPQLVVEAALTYPRVLTQQLVVKGSFESLGLDLNTLAISLRQVKVELAGLLSLALANAMYSGEQKRLSGNLSVLPFNPEQVMNLVKIGDKKLSAVLPPRADPETLQQASLDVVVGFDISPLKLQLEKLQIKVDDTSLQGNVELQGATDFAVNLNLDTLNLDRYLPPSENQQDQNQQPVKESKEQPPKEPLNAENIYSKEPILPLELLRAFAINTTLDAGEIIFREQPFTDIKLKATSDGEKLQSSLSAKGFDGKIVVSADILDLTKTIPTLKAKTDLLAINIKKVQEIALDKPLLGGKSKVQLNVTTKGVSVYDWVHSLSGPIMVSMQQGQLLGLNITKTVCEAASKVQGKTLALDGVGEHTNIDRMKLDLAFNQGKGKINDLDIAIPDLGVEAEGRIDLPQLAFKVPLQISVTGNDLDTSCRLPTKIKLPLVCEGRLFEDNPLSFCRPDLSSLQLRIDEILVEEKAKIQAKLEEEKAKIQQQAEQQKRQLQEKADAEKRAAEAKVAAEKRRAEEKLAAEKRAAEEKLAKEKRKTEEKLKNELQKLF